LMVMMTMMMMMMRMMSGRVGNAFRTATEQIAVYTVPTVTFIHVLGSMTKGGGISAGSARDYDDCDCDQRHQVIIRCERWEKVGGEGVRCVWMWMRMRMRMGRS
jgi:hypothetical protein